MGIIIDAIIILFILASVYLGYKKGLVAVAVSLVAFLVAIIITVVLYRPIANFIVDNTDWDEKLEEVVGENIKSIISNENKEDTKQNFTDNLEENTKKEILPESSRSIAINIIYVLTMLILFVISRVLLILINLLADTITSLPILKQFNETGGIVYGLFRGILVVYIILMIVNLVISLQPQSTLNRIIQSSIITKLLMNYNVLNLFLSK